MKRIISVLLVLVLLVSAVPITVIATDTVNEPTVNDETDAQIAEDGGLGSLIANSLEEQESEDDADIENKILDVTMDGKVATVSLNNNVEVKVIVALYDEETKIMLGSGMAEFAEHADTGEVTINIGTMPEYYVVRAFLLDLKNNPLHSSFESTDYTKSHQEFLATTINDFEDETILNFDESENNNFAVFNEGTIIVDETATTNKLVSSDTENLTYVFSDADATLSGLEAGDVFYYTALSEEVIVGKVVSLENDGTNITIISEADVALDDVFQFAKINTTGDGEGSEVDTASADEGVVYEGSYSASTFIGAEVNKGVKHAFVIDKEFQNKNETKKVKLSASLSFAVNVAFEIKLCWGELSIDLSVSETLALEAEVEGTITSNIFKLAVIYIPTGVPGVMIKEEISLVVEFSAALTFTAQIEAVQGVQVSTKKGFVNTSKSPTFDSDIQVSGRFYVGFKSGLSIEALKILEAGVSGEFGAEVIGETRNRVDTKDTKHNCDVCVEGEVNICAKLKVGVSANVWKVIKYEKEKTLYDKKINLFNFYWSSDKGFGIGRCPNDTYNITFQIVDADKNPIKDAIVESNMTDSNGKVSMFCSAGDKTIKVSKSGYQTKTHDFNVTGPDTITITLSSESKTSGNVVHEKTEIEQPTCRVAIIGGTGVGTTDSTGRFYKNVALTLTANEAPEGMKFAYWLINNKIHSYSEIHKIYPTKNITAKAVFVDEDAVIDYHALVNVESMDDTIEANGILVNSSWEVPEEAMDVTFISAGCLVMLKDRYTGDNLYIEAPDVVSIRFNTTSASSTYVFKKMATPGQTWVARAYVQYETADGIIVTIYSDISEATCPIVAESYTLNKPELASVGVCVGDLAMVAADTGGEETITANEYENKVSVQDLVPNNPYVLMVLKGDSSSYSVDTESLLYITDAVADESGNAEFTYYCDNTEAYVAVVFGACNHTPGEWITVTEASEREAGFKAQFCTKCDEVLASEEIPALGLPDIYLSGMTITLDGGVSINYYMNLADSVVTDENAKVVFTLPNGSKKSVAVSGVTPDAEGYYVFTCEVAAKEMTESITAQVITSDDKSEVFTYSVKEYAEYILASDDAKYEDAKPL
ncbi:MAG: hypothetical protein IKK10_05105, partial [Clostridia bacterium]|nr:hypothetical protein [Clostridia bacterium]